MPWEQEFLAKPCSSNVPRLVDPSGAASSDGEARPCLGMIILGVQKWPIFRNLEIEYRINKVTPDPKSVFFKKTTVYYNNNVYINLSESISQISKYQSISSRRRLSCKLPFLKDSTIHDVFLQVQAFHCIGEALTAMETRPSEGFCRLLRFGTVIYFGAYTKKYNNSEYRLYVFSVCIY